MEKIKKNVYFCPVLSVVIMSKLSYGYWEVSIERSGRLKLPTALLRALPEGGRDAFYVTHGFGEHISLWSEDAYQKQMEFMDSLDRNLIRVKQYRNAFLRNTAYLECDAQYRIVIPKPLMELYKIEKEVVLVMDNGKIDLWNSKRYHEKFDMTPEALEQLNEDIHLGRFEAEKEVSDELS
ncbi:MAG: division/cell wall cluster transcriptional repressor MraZ [Bacteroidales bacterium]|nr:division/cell wall cluster transcriptional repressor MraZ [Bacteroidales bacterium]